VTDRNWMIHVVAQVQDCDAEVYVNDIPVARLLQHECAAVSLPVHPQLVQGNNQVRLLINPGPTPAEATEADVGRPIAHNASAQLRLMAVTLGQQPSEDDRGLITKVTFSAQLGRPTTAPVTASAAVQLSVDLGPRQWQRGQRFDSITPALRDSALSFVNQVRDALQAGQAYKLAPLWQSKITEAALAYGLQPTTQLREFVTEWEAAARTPGFQLAPVTAANASLRLVADGRVVDCVGKDWEPLIRVTDMSACGLLLGLGIASIGGQWAVVL
jgi:hypothetical protein